VKSCLPKNDEPALVVSPFSFLGASVRLLSERFPLSGRLEGMNDQVPWDMPTSLGLVLLGKRFTQLRFDHFLEGTALLNNAVCIRCVLAERVRYAPPCDQFFPV
jgi:hypothetical protein